MTPRSFTVFAAVTAVTSAPALAQSAAAQPAATTAAAAVDPAAAAAVRELLAAMDYKTVMLESFKQMTASLPAAMKAGAEGAVRAGESSAEPDAGLTASDAPHAESIATIAIRERRSCIGTVLFGNPAGMTDRCPR